MGALPAAVMAQADQVLAGTDEILRELLAAARTDDVLPMDRAARVARMAQVLHPLIAGSPGVASFLLGAALDRLAHEVNSPLSTG